MGAFGGGGAKDVERLYYFVFFACCTSNIAQICRVGGRGRRRKRVACCQGWERAFFLSPHFLFCGAVCGEAEIWPYISGGRGDE